MADLRPSHLIIELGDVDDARDLYADQKLSCAVCGCTNKRGCPGGCLWVIPGLCSACAPFVKSVTVAAKYPPREVQPSLLAIDRSYSE